MFNDLNEALFVEKSFNQLSEELSEFLIQVGYSKDLKINVFENEEEGVLEIQATTESFDDPLKLYTDTIGFDDVYIFQVDESKLLMKRYEDNAENFQIVDEKITLKKEEAMYE